MKKREKRKWPIVLGIILLVLVTVVVAALLWLRSLAGEMEKKNAESLKKMELTHIEGVNDLEWEYGQSLREEISEYHEKVGGDIFTEYVVYYPTALKEQYPVIVWGNGSQGTYLDYEAALKSLASYGFVVIGNDHELTGNGETIYEMALYAEVLNAKADGIFYDKLDTTRIGVGGHSQGACGAVNAVTMYERSGELFKSLFTTSMPHQEMCVDRFGYWAYQPEKIVIPYFATSGVGDFDMSVAPLKSMKANMDLLPENIPAVIARMKNADHNIVALPCGYMNAWFCWTLKGDRIAGGIFAADGELMTNGSRWQDVEVK